MTGGTSGSRSERPRGLFVIGTDTGVGKTTIASGLLRLARQRGGAPIPFKPAETGCDPAPLDAHALWEAARPPIALADVCLHALRLPAAPALAAEAEGVRLDLDAIVARARALAGAGDFLLVEGAGGLLVPYVGGATTADLAARLGLPVLVVARTSLGTVNHTSLTVREAERTGLSVAAVVLNETEPTRGPQEFGNADLIGSVIRSRPLGPVPYLPPEARRDPDRLADALAAALGPQAIDSLLGGNSPSD
jgi:dethiobiotin synthetase